MPRKPKILTDKQKEYVRANVLTMSRTKLAFALNVKYYLLAKFIDEECNNKMNSDKPVASLFFNEHERENWLI